MEENNSLDLSIYENAIRHLGLSAEQAQNRAVLETRYIQISEAYQTVLERGTMSARIGGFITATTERVTSFMRTLQPAQAALEENKEER